MDQPNATLARAPGPSHVPAELVVDFDANRPMQDDEFYPQPRPVW